MYSNGPIRSKLEVNSVGHKADSEVVSEEGLSQTPLLVTHYQSCSNLIGIWD